MHPKNLIIFGITAFAISAIGFALTYNRQIEDVGNIASDARQKASIDTLVLSGDLRGPGGDAPAENDKNFMNGVAESRSGAITARTNSGVPVVSAKKVLVADLLTKEEFFSKDSSARWPMASITKLMTAYIAGNVFGPKNIITLKNEDFNRVDSWTNGLKPGQSYIAHDLTRIMLLPSSNEAAEAFARTYGRERFISELNIQARIWGLTSTHFADPSGLAAGNQSTASDLLEMAGMIYQEAPEIFEITMMPKKSFSDLDSGEILEVKNTNVFAGDDMFLGGKTGFTPEAGGNLLSIFDSNKAPIFIVVMGSEDRFGDTKKLLNWFINDISASN